MKYVAELFESSWAQALGWTLLHSLWQSFVLLGIVIALFRFIPGSRSSVRYGVAVSGMLIMFLASVTTFFYYSTSADTAFAYERSIELSSPVPQAAAGDVSVSWWNYLYHILQSNLPFITACWLAGALLFCLRLAGSWWYVSALKRQARILDNDWSRRIKALAREFNIDRAVVLAETYSISAPAVVGYFKPVILIPVGMLSGLSTEQVESIFIHELTHIRRHDYLINIIQSLVEALFFFNPFVWIISNIIRREREHCCDDAVVAHSNANAYAYALVQLEESRLARTGLALSLADNKNQLLNRITRIMEKSVRNYSGREKIIPVLLLVAGLLCASWVTVRTQPTEKIERQDNVVKADTTIKKHSNRPRSKADIKVETEVIREEPLEEITEEVEVNETFPIPFGAVPPIPDLEIPELDFEAMAMPVEPMPPFPAEFDFNTMHLQINIDTVPPKIWIKKSEDWQKFSDEFETKFKDQFGDFYQNHQEEFQNMMQEFRNNFSFQYEGPWKKEMKADKEHIKAEKEAIEKSQEVAVKVQREVMKAQADALKKEHEVRIKANKEAFKAQADAMKELKIHHEEMTAKAMTHQKQMMEDMAQKFQYIRQQNEEQAGKMDKKMKLMEENIARFEKALQEQLVKDGYLKSDDKIRNVEWSDTGMIKINDFEIKDEDKGRYMELHRKFFH